MGYSNTETKKNYSFRLNDETVREIDKQKGETRTEKFENLVFSRSAKIKELDAEIKRKEERLKDVIRKLEESENITSNLQGIENYIAYALRYVENLKK